MLRNRRRPRYGLQICAVISILLLFSSVSLLYTRLSSSPQQHTVPSFKPQQHDIVSESKIDVEDTSMVEDEDQNDPNDSEEKGPRTRVSSSGYYMDHVTGSIRRYLNKKSIDDWDFFDYNNYNSFTLGLNVGDDRSKEAFGSDDIIVDELIRRKLSEVNDIEDALLLKTGKNVSPLREGWADWFEKKSVYLRRDKMFKSISEVMNPLNNPLLQDPDGIGVAGLTRGDKIVQKMILSEFKKLPFGGKRSLSGLEVTRDVKGEEKSSEVRRESGKGGLERGELKRAERRTLDENLSVDAEGQGGVSDARKSRSLGANGNILNENNGKNLMHASNLSISKTVTILNEDDGRNLMRDKNLSNGWTVERVNYMQDRNSSGNVNLVNTNGIGGGEQMVETENRGSNHKQRKPEELTHIYADGKRWGYFPGLHPHLSFSDFVDLFFKKGKCDMRVFMVWNSPPWTYSIRHQRGLESLLSLHRDACVVVFSETIELDFFNESFVKDGYKVAVAMPNLDELLKDTPTHIFASVWFEWRKTKFYPTHYSELVRLAALYKYGGIYLDSDIIVLNSLSSLDNTVGMEDTLAGSSLNGAVMAFRKNSPFIANCLNEFYMTYDDTRLRWNGAELLTRVSRSFMSKENKSIKQRELKVQPSYIFFPIGSQSITSYFTTPANDNEKARQDALFKKIRTKSLTFHFWNSLTSTLIPEPESLVSRLIDHSCIHCFDLL